MKKLISYLKSKQLLFFTFLIVIDQLSKYVADHFGYVVENGGVSFGLLNGFGGEIYVQLVLLLVLFYVLHQTIMPTILKILFLAGVFSNTIDRFLMGGVVRDWLTLPLVGITNNFADWFIFFAIVLYVIKYTYEYRNNLRR